MNRRQHLREAAEALLAAFRDSPWESSTWHRGFFEGFEEGTRQSPIVGGTAPLTVRMSSTTVECRCPAGGCPIHLGTISVSDT